MHTDAAFSSSKISNQGERNNKTEYCRTLEKIDDQAQIKRPKIEPPPKKIEEIIQTDFAQQA